MWLIGLVMEYNFVIFFVKLTLFLLYFRLFGVSRHLRIFIYIGIASMFIVYAGATIVVGIFCFPRAEKTWSEAVSDVECQTQNLYTDYMIGSFGVISDFYILSLPIVLILRMQMPRKKKVGICALFMIGFL